MSKTATVSRLPECDIHKHLMHEPNVPAAYDGKTTLGRWGFMCESCFQEYGTGLGTGIGQKLVTA